MEQPVLEKEGKRCRLNSDASTSVGDLAFDYGGGRVSVLKRKAIDVENTLLDNSGATPAESVHLHAGQCASDSYLNLDVYWRHCSRLILKTAVSFFSFYNVYFCVLTEIRTC